MATCSASIIVFDTYYATNWGVVNGCVARQTAAASLGTTTGNKFTITNAAYTLITYRSTFGQDANSTPAP